MSKLHDILGVNAASEHPNSRVAKALARAGVAKSRELMRVLQIPRRSFDLDTTPDASPVYALGACGDPECPYCESGAPKLRPLQSAILIECSGANGGFIYAGVGEGKTLPSLLLHDAMNARRTVLLVPPNLRDKTLDVDEPELRKHFTLPPVYAPTRGDAVGPPGVYVLGYSDLSATDASGLLEQIKPDLIVADEAHNLARREAARTRRFLRYMRQNSCRFVPMSGSMLNRSLTEIAHLIELALGHNSPLPNHYPDLVQWSDAIDREGEEGATEPGALEMLRDDGETLRAAWRRRLLDTPGVVSTTAASVSIPIRLRTRKVAPAPAAAQALAELHAKWAWAGEEYDDTLEIIRVARQLAQGFYYRLVWPGAQDTEWIEKRNAWRRAVRKRLMSTNREGMDSPALLENAARRGDWTPLEWFDWLAVADRAPPGQEVIEIDRGLVQVALDWAAEDPAGGIVWVDSPVVGGWLRAAGIPYYGAGDDAELLAIARRDNPAPPNVIACSVQAHGTGKNLQYHWSRNLVLYPRAKGGTWEQLIGRTHRPGQRAARVDVDVLILCEEAQASFERAIADAKFTNETSGQPQKLLFADRES